MARQEGGGGEVGGDEGGDRQYVCTVQASGAEGVWRDEMRWRPSCRQGSDKCSILVGRNKMSLKCCQFVTNRLRY